MAGQAGSPGRLVHHATHAIKYHVSPFINVGQPPYVYCHATTHIYTRSPSTYAHKTIAYSRESSHFVQLQLVQPTRAHAHSTRVPRTAGRYTYTCKLILACDELGQIHRDHLIPFTLDLSKFVLQCQLPLVITILI